MWVSFAVSGERQRADIEIPVLPYADYQFDGPVTDPSLLPTTTSPPPTPKKTPPPTTSTTTPTTTVSTQQNIERTTSTATTEPAVTTLLVTRTSTGASTKPTDKSEGTKEEISPDKVTYYPHNPPNDRADTPIKPANIERADTKPSIQAVEKDEASPASPDEMSYIIAGSVAGGVALIGGVALTIGILASQGKLGSPSGFSPVSTGSNV